jgi:hypothetical protein
MYVNNTEELHNRLIASIREIKIIQRKAIREIRMRPDTFNLLVSSCPADLIRLNSNGKVIFYGVPIVRKIIDKDKVYEIELVV